MTNIKHLQAHDVARGGDWRARVIERPGPSASQAAIGLSGWLRSWRSGSPSARFSHGFWCAICVRQDGGVLPPSYADRTFGFARSVSRGVSVFVDRSRNEPVMGQISQQMPGTTGGVGNNHPIARLRERCRDAEGRTHPLVGNRIRCSELPALLNAWTNCLPNHWPRSWGARFGLCSCVAMRYSQTGGDARKRREGERHRRKLPDDGTVNDPFFTIPRPTSLTTLNRESSICVSAGDRRRLGVGDGAVQCRCWPRQPGCSLRLARSCDTDLIALTAWPPSPRRRARLRPRRRC